MLMFNIMLQIYSCDSFLNVICEHRTRVNSFKLFVPASRVNCRQHLFQFVWLMHGTHYQKM